MNQVEKAKKKFLEFSHRLEAKIEEDSGIVENKFLECTEAKIVEEPETVKHTWTRIKATFPEKKEAMIDITKTGNKWCIWFETENRGQFIIEDDDVCTIMLSAQDSTEHKTYISLSEIDEVSETGKIYGLFSGIEFRIYEYIRDKKRAYHIEPF